MGPNIMPLDQAGNYGASGSASGGNPNAAMARLPGEVSTLAPLATNFHAPQAPSNVGFNSSLNAGNQSGIQKFANFFSTIGSEVGHVTGAVTGWLAKQTANMVAAPVKFGAAWSHGMLDSMSLGQVHADSAQLTDQANNLHAQFKSGMISSADYQLQLKILARSSDALVQQTQSLDNRVNADQTQAYTQGINTIATVMTVITAGFGGAGDVAFSADGLIPVGEKTAAQFLTSTNANAFLSNVETGLSKIAADPALFDGLSAAAQKAVQSSIADVITNTGSMTAAQIGRAAAVNLALKYPIYYQMVSSQGNQIYKELDQAKYGAAVRDVAIGAMFLTMGGPIGQAFDKLGDAFKVAKFAVFGQSSFIDELSKGIGNGTSSGLYDAIMALPKEEQLNAIHQMSAVEATNMAAAGNDPVAAAWRVLNGMAKNEGAAMDTFTHAEALNNMTTFAEAQRLADTTAKGLGIPGVTVGRVDQRALNQISTISGSMFPKQAWEALKAENPTQAWANNENFDKQINNLIINHADNADLAKAIKSIDVAAPVQGFPKSVVEKLGKMGYMGITPMKLEAPFQEGGGRLASKFAGTVTDLRGNAMDSSFFVHTVEPLPVLKPLGDAITALGVSPVTSTQRVYQVFNDNLASNLSNLSSFKQIKNDMVATEQGKVADKIATAAEKGVPSRATAKEVTDASVSDKMIKALSSYAHDLSGRKLPLKAPITDLRQLTIADIRTALGTDGAGAREVRGALMDSMLQAHLTIRSLGDIITDVNYKFNPLAKVYARLQGAFRFSFNPFFQAKLATKTEFLSQMSGGGAIASIFSGDYGKLDGVVQNLRDAGMFEQRAGLFSRAAVGGEAVAEGSAVGPNLTHSLLGVQEKSIAGLIQTQADKMGMDVKSYITAFPNQVRDSIQTIAQYDRNSLLLNSPLMRTLNLAFFPLRFETKVASIMAKRLAGSSMMTQLAVIKGLYSGSAYLKSPEGQAWYSQNSEVIGLFKYFSPLASLDSISTALQGISHGDLKQTVGAFELGGLPFGFIPQLLDAEGLTHFGQSYVNPKTGAIALDYVPVNVRGQIQTAISDLLASMFTYPGATAGLPSKGTVDRWAAAAIAGGAHKTDFQTSTPTITPAQQSFQNTVQSLPGAQKGGSAPAVSQPTNSPFKVPQEPTSITTPTIKTPKAANRRLKKSQYTPALLPGQSNLGQL